MPNTGRGGGRKEKIIRERGAVSPHQKQNAQGKTHRHTDTKKKKGLILEDIIGGEKLINDTQAGTERLFLQESLGGGRIIHRDSQRISPKVRLRQKTYKLPMAVAGEKGPGRRGSRKY